MSNLLTAKDACIIANEAKRGNEITFLTNCLTAIKSAAKAGKYSVSIDYTKYNDIVETITSKLNDLGYTVSYYHDSIINISWENKNA